MACCARRIEERIAKIRRTRRDKCSRPHPKQPMAEVVQVRMKKAFHLQELNRNRRPERANMATIWQLDLKIKRSRQPGNQMNFGRVIWKHELLHELYREYRGTSESPSQNAEVHVLSSPNWTGSSAFSIISSIKLWAITSRIDRYL